MRPFEVPSTFAVGETHESACFDPKYAVIGFPNETEKFYYVENLEERFAHIQAGHSGYVTDEEKKVLYNVVYHLFMLAKKKA